MGAGHAKWVRDEYIGIDVWFGKLLLSLNKSDYGLLDAGPRHPVIAFQTKRHWRDRTPSGLIEYSANQLQDWYTESRHESRTVNKLHMPVPGIGHGGQRIQDVLPIFDDFGDWLNLWTLR